MCTANQALFGVHYVLYLGSGVPTATSAPGSSSSSNNSSGSSSVDNNAAEENPYTKYMDSLASKIKAAQAGSTVVVKKGINTLPNATMKALLAKGDVSLKMEFTYEDKEYVIIIPAGAALDNDIPWYGPLYLAHHYGNRVSGTGNVYEVKPGDCLSKIAAANNMTLEQLLEKNPQIKDPNKIAVHQLINL